MNKILCKIPAIVGITSLVAVNKERYPVSFGNYFSFHQDIDFYGIRCLNMWAENLKAANAYYLSDGFVQGYLYIEEDRKWFVIKDDRIIGDDWYYNKFCWTGCYAPKDVEIIRDMYSIWGDPENELEKFTNPKSYWEKRGAQYNEETGILKYNINMSSRELKADFKIEARNDIAAYYCPNIPEVNKDIVSIASIDMPLALFGDEEIEG